MEFILHTTLSARDLSSSLAKIADSLKNGLPPGMSERIADNLHLSIPRMATGTEVPLGVYLLELQRAEEEARHQELLDALTNRKQTQEAATLQEQDKRRRGGRIPPTIEEKREIVEGWYCAQGRMTQEAYCRKRGICPSTLRNYKREVEARR